MALPTKPELLALDFSSDGQPFVNVASKETLDLMGLNFAIDAQPFVAVGGGTPAPPSPSSTRPLCFVCT